MNTSEAPRTRPPVRRELLIAGGALLVGLIVLPLMIYAAGQLTLGPYHNGGFGTLLKDFYQGLLQGSLAHWMVVLGPYLFLSAFRGLLHVSRRHLRA